MYVNVNLNKKSDSFEKMKSVGIIRMHKAYLYALKRLKSKII